MAGTGNGQSVKYLKAAEVARLFKVSPKTVARWADRNVLPHIRTIGGHRRFPATGVGEFLARATSKEQA